jgi:hypothetical protein
MDLLLDAQNATEDPELIRLYGRAMIEIERLREYEWMYKDLCDE